MGGEGASMNNNTPLVCVDVLLGVEVSLPRAYLLSSHMIQLPQLKHS